MKRAVVALMMAGPMVGCMESATYRDGRPVSSTSYRDGGPVSSTSPLMDRELSAVPAGLPTKPEKPAEPVKTHEQRVRERELAEEAEREEVLARNPWMAWSEQRIEREARENSIFPLQLSADEDRSNAYMIGINTNMAPYRYPQLRAT